MTDAPETRKTHVIRILGTNKDGDVLPDIWADVERMDVAKAVTQNGGNWQGRVRKLLWGDDPDGPDGIIDPRTRDGQSVGDGSRDVTTVKVCSPDEADLSDPVEWIPIDAIKTMRLKRSDQGNVKNLLNKDLTEARIVQKRRVFHRDTSIDDQAQAAFDADPTRKVFVVPGDQYTFTDDTEDKSQYIEHEVITALKARHNGDKGDGNGDDQGKQTKLLNQYIIDQTDEAQLQEIGENGFNPPYRLDPYQNIVNIQFGLDNFFVVTGISGTAFTSPDGLNWTDISGTIRGLFSTTSVLPPPHDGTVNGTTKALGFARLSPGLFLIGGAKFQGVHDISGTFFPYSNLVGSLDGVSWFPIGSPNDDFSPLLFHSEITGVGWGSDSKLASLTQEITGAGTGTIPTQYTSINALSWGAGVDNDLKNVPVDNGIRPVKVDGVTSYYVTGNGVSIRQKSGTDSLEATNDGGNTWNVVASFATPMNVTSFGFASGVFVAVGQNLTVDPNISMIQTSEDGFVWNTTLTISSNNDGLSLLATGKIRRSSS